MQMQYLKITKVLTVEVAEYSLTSEQNELIRLVVDYKNNTYSFNKTSDNTAFVQEAQKFAQGLLERKHAVNLAKREQYY